MNFFNNNINNNVDNVTQGVVEDVLLHRGSTNPAVVIFATCVLEVNSRFFLVVAFEARLPGNDIEEVTVVRITRDQAEELVRAGVRTCRVAASLPTSVLGVSIEPKCGFRVENELILVLFVRIPNTGITRLAFLRSSFCPVTGQ